MRFVGVTPGVNRMMSRPGREPTVVNSAQPAQDPVFDRDRGDSLSRRAVRLRKDAKVAELELHQRKLMLYYLKKDLVTTKREMSRLYLRKANLEVALEELENSIRYTDTVDM